MLKFSFVSRSVQLKGRCNASWGFENFSLQGLPSGRMHPDENVTVPMAKFSGSSTSFDTTGHEPRQFLYNHNLLH
jgi:hypothetical protein